VSDPLENKKVITMTSRIPFSLRFFFWDQLVQKDDLHLNSEMNLIILLLHDLPEALIWDNAVEKAFMPPR
jgi:hypothetical protein